MIKVAVLGYGNVGKMAVDAVLSAKDMELAGIVSRSYAGQTIAGVTAVASVDEIESVDVAVLAMPTRLVPQTAEKLLEKGIYTTDSYDIHGSIIDVRARLDAAAKKGGVAAITAAGWDPGTDSAIRALLLAMAPEGITYTNFGPGMSMGHSVAAKAIDGIKDALSMTIPTGTGIHRRMVYVELESGADLDTVTAALKADDYFAHDDTHVIKVDSVDDVKDVGHGVHLTRKGVSGATHNQNFEFNMSINNPALTAQILISSARAAMRQVPGCYTLIEIAPVDFLDMTRDEAVKKLV